MKRSGASRGVLRAGTGCRTSNRHSAPPARRRKARLNRCTASTASICCGCRPVLRRHSLDDARDVDDRALMGPGADFLLAVHRPHAEEDLATLGARDFRMADDFMPDRGRHEMAHLDARTYCALAHLEVLLVAFSAAFSMMRIRYGVE